MINQPMDILEHFPVRKTRIQKDAFLSAVASYFSSRGYDVAIEKGKLGVRNIVVGNPETARFLVTAHYGTPAALPFPNLITPCSVLPFLGYQILTTLIIFFIAFLPGLLLLPSGISTAVASRIWLLCLYAVLALMLVGPANKNNANDNTSGVVAVLEIARSMPENYRKDVCFVLFDLEEAGLLGSAAYRKAHKKQSDHQIVLNLDCIGDGNEIVLFPTKVMKADDAKMELIRTITGIWGNKSISIREKGFAYYPSDQKRFPYGVGIAAFRRNRWAGLYLSRIHTKKDTILEETNVNILRAAIVSLITCSAVK